MLRRFCPVTDVLLQWTMSPKAYHQNMCRECEANLKSSVNWRYPYLWCTDWKIPLPYVVMPQDRTRVVFIWAQYLNYSRRRYSLSWQSLVETTPPDWPESFTNPGFFQLWKKKFATRTDVSDWSVFLCKHGYAHTASYRNPQPQYESLISKPNMADRLL